MTPVYEHPPHFWSNCDMCGPMVICGKCGNNCCNGGYGEIIGKEPGTTMECDACPSAYQKQKDEYPGPKVTQASPADQG